MELQAGLACAYPTICNALAIFFLVTLVVLFIAMLVEIWKGRDKDE